MLYWCKVHCHVDSSRTHGFSTVFLRALIPHTLKFGPCRSTTRHCEGLGEVEICTSADRTLCLVSTALMLLEDSNLDLDLGEGGSNETLTGRNVIQQNSLLMETSCKKKRCHFQYLGFFRSNFPLCKEGPLILYPWVPALLRITFLKQMLYSPHFLAITCVQGLPEELFKATPYTGSHASPPPKKKWHPNSAWSMGYIKPLAQNNTKLWILSFTFNIKDICHF
jgi:hypothetical protein